MKKTLHQGRWRRAGGTWFKQKDPWCYVIHAQNPQTKDQNFVTKAYHSDSKEQDHLVMEAHAMSCFNFCRTTIRSLPSSLHFVSSHCVSL
jgi:hypothetical protein